MEWENFKGLLSSLINKLFFFKEVFSLKHYYDRKKSRLAHFWKCNLTAKCVFSSWFQKYTSFLSQLIALGAVAHRSFNEFLTFNGSLINFQCHCHCPLCEKERLRGRGGLWRRISLFGRHHLCHVPQQYFVFIVLVRDRMQETHKGFLRTEIIGFTNN